MKLRFLLMGCVLTGMGAVLLLSGRGAAGSAGLLLVGAALLALGYFWK